MAERKSISKKLRFEVFKRDNFTCQYCGRMAPNVVLEVDHINPVSNGGENDIMNLITSCVDCNRGKGKRLLSQNEELKKQQEQLRLLNEKREQLEFMIKWREELSNLENEQAKEIEKVFRDKTTFIFMPSGLESIKKEIRNYGFNEVYEATLIAIDTYFNKQNGCDSANTAFNYIGRICYNRQKQKENPLIKDINYFVKIAKERFYSYRDYKAFKRYLLRNYREGDFETVKDIVCSAYSWGNLSSKLRDYFGKGVYD